MNTTGVLSDIVKTNQSMFERSGRRLRLERQCRDPSVPLTSVERLSCAPGDACSRSTDAVRPTVSVVCLWKEVRLMNDMMRALRAHSRGDVVDLVVDDISVPHVAAGEALIEVHATGITFAELTWDETLTHMPAIPGHEFSGIIAALGDDVTGFSIGDEVYGLIRFERQGAAADYVSMPAADLARKPTSLSHAETAALPLAGLTAWQALFDVAGVKAGERVLIQGGSGGVGIFAVQLAKSVGSTVTATTRGGGVALVQQLGADEVINTDDEDFADGGRRFDVVIDTIGGEVLRRSYDVVEKGGRLVTLQAPPDPALAERAGIQATFFIVSPDVQELDRLAELGDSGELRVVLAATFPFEEGDNAFESGRGTHRASGKTVLVVRS